MLLGPVPADAGGDRLAYPQSVASLVDCPKGWGVEDIPEACHTARSVFQDSSGRGMSSGRLDSDWCWGPSQERLGEWYQLDAGKVRSVGGVVTGGAAGGGKWNSSLDYFVRSITMLHSIDGKSWQPADNGAVYDANRSGASLAHVPFQQSVWARYVRIYPRRWHREIALRAGLLVRERESQERVEARVMLLALTHIRRELTGDETPTTRLPSDIAGVLLRFIIPVPPGM